VPCLDSGQAGPAGTGGRGRRVLMAAHGVGQDDVVRVGLDDVLGGQLRVAAGRRGAGRGVRDALHAEQGEQGTDERRGRDRVVRLVELVVVAERLGAARHRGYDLADLAAQRRVLMLSLGEMASGLAELVELGINAAQAGRRGQVQHRDREAGQVLRQAVEVVSEVRDDHQIGLVRDDRLQVGVEPGQLGHRRLRGVVRVAVDRLDLAPGADRVQHLGSRGRQGDDRRGPGPYVHHAVGGLDDRREGRAPGGARGGPGRRTGTAAGYGGQGQGRGGRGGREAMRERSHDHPPSVVEDEVRPLRRREGIGTNRPSSEDRSPAQVRRPGSSPRGGTLRAAGRRASPLRDSAGFVPASLRSAPSWATPADHLVVTQDRGTVPQPRPVADGRVYPAHARSHRAWRAPGRYVRGLDRAYAVTRPLSAPGQGRPGRGRRRMDEVVTWRIGSASSS